MYIVVEFTEAKTGGLKMYLSSQTIRVMTSTELAKNRGSQHQTGNRTMSESSQGSIQRPDLTKLCNEMY